MTTSDHIPSEITLDVIPLLQTKALVWHIKGMERASSPVTLSDRRLGAVIDDAVVGLQLGLGVLVLPIEERIKDNVPSVSIQDKERGPSWSMKIICEGVLKSGIAATEEQKKVALILTQISCCTLGMLGYGEFAGDVFEQIEKLEPIGQKTLLTQIPLPEFANSGMFIGISGSTWDQQTIASILPTIESTTTPTTIEPTTTPTPTAETTVPTQHALMPRGTIDPTTFHDCGIEHTVGYLKPMDLLPTGHEGLYDLPGPVLPIGPSEPTKPQERFTEENPSEHKPG